MDRDFLLWDFLLAKQNRVQRQGKQSVRLRLIKAADRQAWMETSSMLLIPVWMHPAAKSGSGTMPPSAHFSTDETSFLWSYEWVL